jgi:hypothetical protein
VTEAQEVALRFYIVPKIGDGLTPMTSFRPKYIADLSGVQWGAMDYGRDDTFLVGANVTPAQHLTIDSNIDVISIPQNIDNEIGLTALDTVKARLESLRIPADWVTTNHTYRDVLRITGKGFSIMQRFGAMHGHSFFVGAITLDTRMNQMTATQRQELEDAIHSLANSQGVTVDLSEVGSTTTVRRVLKITVDQLPSFSLMGQVF